MTVKMFKGIASRWKEARASVIANEALDILNRYKYLGSYERYELLSAFDYTKSDLENDNGPVEQWPEILLKRVAERLMKTAKEGFNVAPYGASGMALLSFFIELHQVPGILSEKLRKIIIQWHEEALLTDLPSGNN